MSSSGAILERYVFSVVVNYIHLASSKEQSQLIELIRELDTICLTADGSAQPPDESTEQVPASYLSELQQEWEEVLNKPS
ncbi:MULTISPECIES: hypothetical protein [Spirosoma]|uniref:Uncharacterized protein n=1 Tax=Spirosoma liriopis TaxID=2937440 RepID=A0ABT0HN46_9BACT|nr:MULTISPECIES: hypothetical protein [Spirosoma]MCK8493588.1 hypothetical protein [Spirosoma liriopis]UHG92998.1 hypothetical protein LQ777_08870 [Spirosoma oryzicola]